MEINQLVTKILNGVREFDSLNFFGGKGRFTQTEFRLLMEIYCEEEKGRSIISAELAHRLGVTRSAVSQIISKLEARDVVKRVASSTDKKIAYIRFSDKAVDALKEQCNRINEIMNKVIEDFGEERLQKMLYDFDEFSAAFVRVHKQTGKE